MGGSRIDFQKQAGVSIHRAAHYRFIQADGISINQSVRVNEEVANFELHVTPDERLLRAGERIDLGQLERIVERQVVRADEQADIAEMELNSAAVVQQNRNLRVVGRADEVWNPVACNMIFDNAANGVDGLEPQIRIEWISKKKLLQLSRHGGVAGNGEEIRSRRHFDSADEGVRSADRAARQIVNL